MPRQKKNKYRSKFEAQVAADLERVKLSQYKYEALKIDYVKPETKSKYTPDFILPNGIIIEAKGRFTAQDRKKHLLIKEQHPDLDIRFVFQRPTQTLSKASKTTYAKWCDKHGFKHSKGTVPSEWLK